MLQRQRDHLELEVLEAALPPEQVAGHVADCGRRLDRGELVLAVANARCAKAHALTPLARQVAAPRAQRALPAGTPPRHVGNVSEPAMSVERQC